MNYTKTIEQNSLGMVLAEVHDVVTKKCVGYKYFYSIFSSQEARFKAAHKWADNLAATCEKYSVRDAAVLKGGV